MIKAGIYGATGYAGAELIKILSSHSEVEVLFAASKTYAGMDLTAYIQMYQTFCYKTLRRQTYTKLI